MSKKENLTRILLCVFIIALTLLCGEWTNSPAKLNAQDKFIPTNKICVAYNKHTVTKNDSIKQLLILEVNRYIKSVAPKSSQPLAEHIVNIGLSENVDICFMMSQTQIETTFGTMGMGRPHKKSLFGVERRKYKTYEAAINDYVRILKSRYLVNGKNEQSLLKSYRTRSGARYAKNPNYEKELAKTYQKIKSKTKIYSLQQTYKC